MSAERLYESIRTCVRCPLAKTRTLAVPGEGPLNAEVMFIGEAPGANEDKQGRPFVGAAGQFLSELLAAAGLQRDDVYICNVLKCRPPGNRDPQPDEIDACRDYLDEQIDMVDPLVIVTLGRYSMARYFPKQAISRIHGQAREIAGVYYVPMYHPAAALHQQSLKAVMLEDFRKLGALLTGAKGEHSNAATPPLREPEPAAVHEPVYARQTAATAVSAEMNEPPPPTIAAAQDTKQIPLFD